VKEVERRVILSCGLGLVDEGRGRGLGTMDWRLDARDSALLLAVLVEGGRLEGGVGATSASLLAGARTAPGEVA
jgi:hypothetical protein